MSFLTRMPMYFRAGAGLWRALLFSSSVAGCSVETAGTQGVLSVPDLPDARNPIMGHGEDAQVPGGDVSQPPMRDGSIEDSGGDQKSGCSLTGTFALSAQADVVWDGTSLGGVIPVIAAGAGQLSIATLLQVTDDAQGTRAEVQPCGVYVPEFRSPTVQENYAVDFPDGIWNASGMPRWSVDLHPTCREPDCALESEMLNALLGVNLQDPEGPWPTSRGDPRLTFRDDDDDGYLGLTVITRGPADVNAQGEPYAHPPVDPLTSERATKIMLGIRVMTRFSGALVSCDELEGAGPNTSIDTRAATCARNQGSIERECDVPYNPFNGQAEFVDGNLPVWEVQELRWRGTRLPALATCEDARAAFATHW